MKREFAALFAVLLLAAFASAATESSTASSTAEAEAAKQKAIDEKANQKYTWLKKSLRKKAKAFEEHSFAKDFQRELERQAKIKEEARKYVQAKNQKLAAQHMQDLKTYYPYLVNGKQSDSESEESSNAEIPIYYDDDSLSGKFWNIFGYSNHVELDPKSDLTTYYMRSKGTQVKLDSDGNLYLAVNKY